MATANELKIRPLGDKIVVKIIAEAETTQGGIYIPDAAREKPQKGVVIAVGPGKILEDGKGREIMEVAVGETVLLPKYGGGTEVKTGNSEYKILSVKEIFGVIE